MIRNEQTWTPIIQIYMPKNKRIYSTDTRRLIIFYMDSFSDVEEKFFIDKRVFLNEDFKIKQNAVLIGTNEFKPYNCEQNFQCL